MAGMAATFLQFYPTKGNIQVIVDGDEIFNGKFVKSEGFRNGTTGQVHEGLWFEEDQPFTLPAPLSAQAGEILPGYGDAGQMR